MFNPAPRETDCRLTLLEAFDNSDGDYPFAPVEDQFTRRETYYRTMCKNILAEAVAAFRSGPRTRLMIKEAPRMDGEWVQIRAPDDSDADLDVKDNILDLDGDLFWVTKLEVNEATNVTFIQGMGIRGRRLSVDRFAGGWQFVRNRLFAGDYCSRYRCSLELQSQSAPVPQMEAAILRPALQAPGIYPMAARLREEVMQINPAQRSAVLGLRNRIEIIHGPPGTGKSTTIFHIVATKLPRDSVAVVTCVTNQAIDAVAEKLKTCHELPRDAIRMLVLGNPKRVGKTAGKYTLDELVKRDPLVLTMKYAVNVLQKTLTAVNGLQKARVDRLLREHRRSRLSETALAARPLIQRMMRESGASYLFNGRKTATECHLEVVNRVKRQMIEAFIKSRSFKLRRANMVLRQNPYTGRLGLQRNVRYLTGREWDVATFQRRLEAALRRAQQGLTSMQISAASRTVRDTQVVLCTIPSAYKVAKLREDYESFTKGIFIGILDEAAATAETYVPMLVELGIQHLVMLGDHKQLSPLVMAQGGDRELDGMNIDRSLMERAMAGRIPMHRLTEQYRMPRVLCSLVSRLFYQDSLTTGANKPHPTGRELRWLKIETNEVSVGTSKANSAEALAIFRLLSYDPVLSRPGSEIMIIALYKPQANLLKQMVEEFFPRRRVQVVTVDAAQGSEAPHIVLSTVRSNHYNDIGFAKNPRRLCVAISRAQESLTIVGSLNTFSESVDIWRRVTAYFSQQGAVEAAPQGDCGRGRNFVEDTLEEMQSRFKGKGKGEGKGSSKGKGKGKGFGRGKGAGFRPSRGSDDDLIRGLRSLRIF